MKQVTTYVGIDAHKKDLFIAMLVGEGQTPVTWTVPNEPKAVGRLVRKLEREAPARPWIESHCGVTRDLPGGPKPRELEPAEELAAASRSIASSPTLH